MRGISIFLNQEISDEEEGYISRASKAGFAGIFTSLHIPEDDASKYKERLIHLGKLAVAYSMTLMVDFSGDALERAGFSLDKLQELKGIGVTGLRADYAITNQQIAQMSRQITVGLNASTLTESDLKALKDYGADFSKLEAWHNYYPRPETGLDEIWLKEKNEWLATNNLRVAAFVPGNAQLRGPLEQGLPTLEAQRYGHPLASTWELENRYVVDDVYIGDPGLKQETFAQWLAFEKEKTVQLYVQPVNDKYDSLLFRRHMNRLDEARDVIRSADARFQEVKDIYPENTVERCCGAVTLDNQKYSRYMGELQIIKRRLPADEKVNVVGQVVKEDLALLKLIGPGTYFELKEE